MKNDEMYVLELGPNMNRNLQCNKGGLQIGRGKD